MALAIACTQKKETYDWAPAGDHILTEWGENLDVTNVLPEYPRPQMVRDQWMNLNGFWDYHTRNSRGKILVPFPIESALSGVGERLDSVTALTYSTTVKIPASYLKKHVLLNCGGIDCIAEIKVNDEYVRKHIGGYTAISEDITEYLKKGENEIVIKVTDHTDADFHAVGKQRNDNNGIWYSPVSGIWQTIWLEPVDETHIEKLKITPYLDLSTFSVNAATSTGKGEVEVKIFDGKRQVASGKGEAGKDINIKMKEPKLWTPDDPFLYDFKITVKDGGKTVDQVKSYSAMRKVSVNKDYFGTLRIALNNKPIFSFGLLDQGWWPDGLYTAPTDEALEFDVRRTKELGFNTVPFYERVNSIESAFDMVEKIGEMRGDLEFDHAPHGKALPTSCLCQRLSRCAPRPAVTSTGKTGPASWSSFTTTPALLYGCLSTRPGASSTPWRWQPAPS